MKLLKLLMFASASLPQIGETGAPYQSKKGISNPAKVISSTANISAFNLQELKTRLEHSTLFSLFSGVLSQPVNPVLLDCGASACTSPDIDAFEPESLQTLKKPIMLQGVGGGVEITMQGILSYQTIDDNGNPLIIRVPGYYAPHLKQSLFSPQILFMTSHPHATLTLSGTTATLHFSKSVSMTLHLDLPSRLFYMPTFSNVQKAADELLCNLSLTQDTNQNLSHGQKALLKFHHALCHVGFGTIRKIGKLGWLGTKGQ